MTSLSDRLRQQSFHFMRFAGHGDRLNDSKAKHKVRNELLCRRSQRAGWVRRRLLRRRAWLERVSKPRLWHVFDDTLAHFLSDSSKFMFETRRRFTASCLFLLVSLTVTLENWFRAICVKHNLPASSCSLTPKMGNRNSAVKTSTEQRTQWELHKKCDRSWYEEWEVELWWFLFYFRWFLFLQSSTSFAYYCFAFNVCRNMTFAFLFTFIIKINSKKALCVIALRNHGCFH